MARLRESAGAALATLLLAGPAGAVQVPEEGRCPPYPLAGEDAAEADVIPPQFSSGERISQQGLERLQKYLPDEIWERRQVFFFEGMQLEIGPCHRRYPAPPFFVEATRGNAGKVRIDAEGNLLDYDGGGLPFPWQDIADDDSQAGWKWAWNYRYRYQGSGFRGDFRILHVARRGRKVERFTGRFYLLPMHGVPGATLEANGARFWAGGKFETPEIARGVAWRQLRPAEADRKPDRSDEIWVWTPEERRVRRAPPTGVEGIFTPTYTRGNVPEHSRLVLPDGTQTPGASIAAAEHTRRGFTGIFLRPNQYRFSLLRFQDVIAPINSNRLGYPADPNRSYGPSGLSLASDRWEIRRAAVLSGVKKQPDDQVARVEIYVDVLTQQPLYLITRRSNRHIFEVGMFMGRYSADDPAHPRWKGSDAGFGTLLPVAASFSTRGGEGWLRESFELRSDPPEVEEARDFTSTIKLQRGR